jgi:putative N6-adenine-specific DNA methylase
MEHYRLFATCARGLEPVLAAELQELGAVAVEPGRGGVHFGGDKAVLYKANLWLRTAVRVLKPILEAPVRSPEELYDAVQTVDWSRYLTTEQTLAVDCNVRDSAITHSHYASLKTKDAICDQFVARTGRRPSVDTDEPMVPLNLHIAKNAAVLSLDSSGTTLHKRGYRPVQTKAPLNEALAAGLVLLTGWDRRTPFADPLCGSGTLPIEACWIAIRRPPGLTRRRFGFHGWPDFDVRLWTALRDEARQAVGKALSAPIVGSDVRRDALTLADQNARAAGVGNLVQFTRQDLRDFRPPAPPPGVILCNPPYGLRIGEVKELAVLYRLMGEVFKERCGGYSVYVFTGNPELERHIGLQPAARTALYNGKIPCRLLRYDLR